MSTIDLPAATRSIYCCGCGGEVEARLIDGREAYPHRRDLGGLPFWKCGGCGNFVGCHHKTADRTRPLGCIPDAPMKNARKHVHALLDPLWESGRFSRRELYDELSLELGREYHTAELRTVEEARSIYRAIKAIAARRPPARPEIVLPQNYEALTAAERKAVREEYARVQGGKCRHCKAALTGPPAPEIQSKPIELRAFPEGFLRWPVHLHHDRTTGMTLGAVHARCNAVLWQYHGE